MANPSQLLNSKSKQSKKSDDGDILITTSTYCSPGSIAKHISISYFGSRDAPYVLLFLYSLGFLIAFILTSAIPSSDSCADAELTLSLDTAKYTETMNSWALHFIVFGMATGAALLRGFELIGFISEDGASTTTKKEASQMSTSENQISLPIGGRSRTLTLVVIGSFLVFSMQSLAYASISFGFGTRFCAPAYLSLAPRVVHPLRFAYWSFSNPLMVIVTAEVVGAPPWQQLGASLVTCLVCIFGLGMEYFMPTSPSWIILLVLSFLCSTFVEIVAFVVLRRALSVASQLVDGGKGLKLLIIGLGVADFIIWNAFPIIFLASQLGGISPGVAEGIAFPLLDGFAKVVICALCTTLANVFSLADLRAKAKVDALRLLENAKATSSEERRVALTNFAMELRVPISSTAGATADVLSDIQTLRTSLESLYSLLSSYESSPSISSSCSTLSVMMSKTSANSLEAVSSATTLASVLDDFLEKEGVHVKSYARLEDFEGNSEGDKNTTSSISLVSSKEGGFDMSRLNLKRFSVSDLFIGRICSSSGLLGQVALRKGITLTSTIGRAVPAHIVCDESRLSFVLTLLLQKCISTCPRGGKISASISSIGWGIVPVAGNGTLPSYSVPMPFIKFSFQDDGLGLGRNELDRVFDEDIEEEGGFGVRRQATLKVSSIAPAPETESQLSNPKKDLNTKTDKEVVLVGKDGNAAYSMSLCRTAASVLGGSVAADAREGFGTRYSLKIPAFSTSESLLKAVKR